MRALLLLGAIIVELFVGVMLIGGISYGITQSYSIGAAGYGRMGVIGMVLALLFLWIFAWFPSLLALGILLRLPRSWRGESDTRIKKIGITFAAIFMMFATAC